MITSKLAFSSGDLGDSNLGAPKTFTPSTEAGRPLEVELFIGQQQ